MRLCETPSGDMETGGPMRYMQRRDYDFLWEAHPGTTSDETGIPKYYATRQATTAGGNVILTFFVAPAPDDAYNIEIEYQGKLTTDSITSGNTPGGGSGNHTWISASFPDVLLYGALVEGYTYMKGEADVMAVYQKHFNDAVLLLKNHVEGRQETDTFKANDEGAK